MKRAILSGTLLVAASILSNCSRKTTQAAPGVPEVLVTTVLSQAVPLVSERVATLDGLVNATISARVSGYIVSRNNEEGSAVKSGDLLFQIVLRPYEAALAQAKANLAKARATQLKAEQDEKRALELVKSGAISVQERDTAVQAAEAARADTQAGEAAVQQADLNLEYTKITAPIHGIAGFATAQIGDLVGPSSSPLESVQI